MAEEPGEKQISLASELRNSIRKEAVGKASVWAVIASLGLVGVALLGLWFWIEKKLPEFIGTVPRGAVLAFDLSEECPAGWDKFADANGRTIIGANNLSQPPLTAKPFRVPGGEEMHTLTIAEMPRHNHSVNGEVPAVGTPWKSEFGASGSYSTWDINAHPYVGTHIDLPSEGGGKAHSIMQPYLPLLYCKKK